MDIKELSPEQLTELRAQMKEREKADKEREKAEKKAYETMRNDFVERNVNELIKLSAQMQIVKQRIFGDMDTLIAIKNEKYKTKTDRRSDTFTNEGGTKSITLGFRVNDGWDDTVNQGEAIVKDYMASLADTPKSAKAIKMVMSLLSRNKEGNLSSSRVLILEKQAVESGDEQFMRGVDIIRQSYRPAPSCQFIEVTLTDENGKKSNLPLSLSAMK